MASEFGEWSHFAQTHLTHRHRCCYSKAPKTFRTPATAQRHALSRVASAACCSDDDEGSCWDNDDDAGAVDGVDIIGGSPATSGSGVDDMGGTCDCDDAGAVDIVIAG